MKKLALTIVCAVATTGAAFAQGLVSFTTSHSFITAQTNTAVSTLFGGPGTGGTSGATAPQGTGAFDYALLYATGVGVNDANVWDGTWSFATGLTATNATTAGWLVSTATSGSVPWAVGVTDSIVLVGWSANLGTSWTTVSNVLAAVHANPGANNTSGFFGESTFGYITGNTTPAPGAAIFAGGADANGLPIDNLNMQLYALPVAPVPEPATMALAGLSGLALVLFRRRK
jgi:hypothetical protein